MRFLGTLLLVVVGRWTTGLASPRPGAGDLALSPVASASVALAAWLLPLRGEVVGPVLAAALFLALWMRASAGQRLLFEERQRLQFALLAKTEELAREQANMKDAHEALRTHAIRDELTGLPSRTSILEILDREMARAVRDKSTLSVVFADVDHLGKINDAHGKPVGDEVLKEVGHRLEHAIRSYDAAGRYEGGEFLLVLPNFEADTGVERLRKIHDSLCGKPMPVAAGPLPVTCSFGVSILLPDQFYSAEELLERAGQAMTTAKQDGRNRIGFFARSGG
jgi:diguanylate cyclase (GGDEF)-like protein